MLTFLDNSIIFIAGIIILGIGYFFSRVTKDMESFYLANRSLPWSLLVGTLVASWYGAAGVIGSIGYAAVYGISVWAVWCIAAHAARIPLALWVGPKVQVRTDVTIPDLLENLYGKKVAIIGACVLVFSCASFGCLLGGARIGLAAWGIPEVMFGIILITITVVIASLGGLMGVAVTDMIMFFFMVFGVTMVFPGLFSEIGGFAGLQVALGDKADVLLHPTKGMSVGKMVTLVVLSFNVYADPSFYQRFSAAESAKSARRALLTCFSLWIVFDIILTVMGILVTAFRPEAQPEVAYITLVLESLPVGIKGLFMLGLLGATISTLDSYYLVGATLVTNDIYARIRGPENITQEQIVKITRIAIVVVGFLGLTIAFRFELIYDVVVWMQGISMSVLFIPVVGGLMFKGRKTEMGGLLSMIGGCGTLLILRAVEFSLFSPVFIALAVAFICYSIGNRIGEDRNKLQPTTVSNSANN